MKKTALFLVIILLCFCNITMASATYTPFTLRNGYYWGMPKEEVLVLAREEGLGPNTSKGEKVVSFDNVPVGDFSVRMLLSLDESLQLDSIYYLFPGVPEDQRDQVIAMFEKLTQALADVYGPSEPVIIPLLTIWKLPDTRIELTRGPVWGIDGMRQCVITYKFDVPVRNGGF